jgi:hypothetical protein
MIGGREKTTARDNAGKAFNAAGIRIRFSERHNALLATVDQDAAKKVRRGDSVRKRIPALAEMGGLDAAGQDAVRRA